ncbi:hypothetical protein HN51_040982 [Arachis hypogaea]|uniref:F-box domain-containing protein n=1 Tax=Arachis hypogaea TaxID=3818 RepID=A0A444YQP3_ARAHY|nr:F-box protein At5g07610-like [Arachis ipaensis]XP_025661778.1 F-box protein At5g07610 [Arachis hypogaea]QHN86673.1 F-box protein [Arachis hypogaea]RYR04225.1 hypothetical protein Ahy_B06g083855 [Arachis hypogaea]
MKHSPGDAVAGNKDLMTDIFLRLPAKDVIRCKCVCKEWLALISNPQFGYSHTLRFCRNNRYPRVLLLRKISDDTGNMKVCVVPFTSNDQNTLVENNICEPVSSILQSCNGLLLCDANTPPQSTNPRTKNFEQRCSYRVINPAINCCFNLTYNSIKPYPHFLMPFLYYEPQDSPYYKVIMFSEISWTSQRSAVEISVYSSETDSWTEYGVFCQGVPVKFGVYCNGFVHWFSPHKILIYFDIKKLCFNELRWTSYEFCIMNVQYFGQSGGNLHLVVANPKRELEYHIWELEKDYCGWILKYHMDLNRICEGVNLKVQYPADQVSMCVVCQENEEEDSAILFLSDSNDDEKIKIVSYNLNNHGSRILHELNQEYSFKALQYFETLSRATRFDHV